MQKQIAGWKLWIVECLGLGKHLYLGPEGIEQALRDKLRLGKQLGFTEGQQAHPICLSCPLYQAQHDTDPQAQAMRNLIGTKTLPTVNGEFMRKAALTRKLRREQGIS